MFTSEMDISLVHHGQDFAYSFIKKKKEEKNGRQGKLNKDDNWVFYGNITAFRGTTQCLVVCAYTTSLA